MASSKISEEELDHKYQNTREKIKSIFPTLPKGQGWMTEDLLQYQDFWISPASGLPGVFLIQEHFKAQPTDIILSSAPKTGTTWLKSLIFATINRANYEFSTHPLLENNAHDLFPFLEQHILWPDSASRLESLPPPRLIATHIPYPLIPDSMNSSGCKFIYICRDPKDVLVSTWHFAIKYKLKHKNNLPPLSLDEAFNLFCKGISPYGPYWDHVLGYWRLSLERPNTILFLKYEVMKRDPHSHVRNLAEFLGVPFSVKEENEGVIENIINLCSFEIMSNLEVNKSSDGQSSSGVRLVGNKDFFRKGEVGDWKNHLTPEMAATLDQIIEEKLQGSGFSFGCSP